MKDDGTLVFFGYGLIHFVEQLMVIARVALDGLPDGYCIPSFLAFLRWGLKALLRKIAADEVEGKTLLADSFSDDDLLDITFLLDDQTRSADLVVTRVSVGAINPELLAGQ